MKAFLGFIQIGLGIVGIVALVNGQWLGMIAAWAVGFGVGYLGNRAVRATDGISQLGQDALGNVDRAIDLLRRGEFRAASGVTRSTISSFRMGGDKRLMPMALALHAVALASSQDLSGARRALQESREYLGFTPRGVSAEADELRQLHALIQREIESGVKDPELLVAGFLDWNDTH